VDFSAVADTIEAAVAGGAFPGAVVLLSRGGKVVYHAAFGARSLEPERAPMGAATVFDLSSLTKPLATATALMILLREGKMRLEDRVTRFLPNFGVHGKGTVSLRHLLAHCGGLAAWRPFHRDIVREERQGRPNFVATRGAKEFVYEQIHRERPSTPPARDRCTAISASSSSGSWWRPWGTCRSTASVRSASSARSGCAPWPSSISRSCACTG